MYRILIQRDKKVLGVLERTFDSSEEIDAYIDAHYPDCFYSTEFVDTARVNEWVRKFGILPQ